MDPKILAIILICTITPIVAIMIFVLAKVFSKHRYAKTVKELHNQYDLYHTQLTVDCLSSISRLGSLGRYSNQFNIHYLERKKQYDDLLNKKDRDMSIALNSIDTLFAEKHKTKEFKEVLNQAFSSLKEYSRSVSSFSDDLNSLLHDDSQTREGILGVKETFRRIKAFYNENINELKPLEKPFSGIFHGAERTFSKYEELTNQAKYEEAKNLIPKIEKVLSALDSIKDDLPSFVSLSTKVIPEKLNRLNQDYQNLLNDGYILDYLNVDQMNSSINSILNNINEKLQVLDVTDVKSQIAQIQSCITDILAQFDNERKAKDQVVQSRDIIITSTYGIEKEYSSAIKALPINQKTFFLDRKYVEQMGSLKNDIEAISYLKRDLDSYLDTSNRQPYTIVCRKINELQIEIGKVKRTMQDYTEYINSLKSKSQDVYNGLRNYYLSLKKSQYQMKSQIGVESYVSAQNMVFRSLFGSISEIDHILVTLPVDVTKAGNAFAPFVAKCDQLINEINEKTEACKSAETAIVYANAYRIDFSDSRQMLDIAEKAFNEGDFDRAKSEALKIVKIFSTQISSNNF
ncbi:MAG: septation ring formation regulator EzrA [Bacilli bacterium]